MIDTHCHIHDPDYKIDPELAIKNAAEHHVDKLIVVGTDLESSQLAVKFAETHDNVWSSVGLHPHDSQKFDDLESIEKMAVSSKKLVAIGECGLDYYYLKSDISTQKDCFKKQIELAIASDLAIIFHIRGAKDDSADAYEDFWRILDEYKTKIRGVVHSFSAHKKQLDQALERGLYIGVNGISTFCGPGEQLEAYKSIPLERMVLETDSPFLTPAPFRGQVNQPMHIDQIARYLSELRNEDLSELRRKTTSNAERLFSISV